MLINRTKLIPRRLAPLVALGLGVPLALASCTSTSHRQGAGASSTSTSSSSTPASTTASTIQTTLPTVPPTSSSTATSPPSGPTGCATGALTGTLTGANGAAGSVYYSLVLTNTGSVACTLQGYPGVSFVTGPSGPQVGAAAARATGSAPALTLAPGSKATASLQITDATNYGTACQVTPVAGLKVYPPGQTSALYVAHPDKACANTNDVTLHIGALQPS
jgi:hypothetical protein